MRFNSAVWLAGFRPFFLMALLSGITLPVIWAILFSGQWSLPATSLPLVQWHAHEMFYGFGWAVLGGFLLTASKNWVKIRGIHGGPLAALTALWIAERAAVLYAAGLPPTPRFLLLNLFVLSCTAYIVYSLVRYRHQDSFRDNYFFLIGLPLFLVAKNLLLDPAWFTAGAAMSVGLFRLAFAVMLERTTPQFMKNAMNIEIVRRPELDTAVKVLVLASVFAPFMPAFLASLVLCVAGLAMLIRFLTWRPLRGLSNFGIALMYIGHLGLIIHLFMEAAKSADLAAGVGTLATHVFTFVCMGIIIPGMLLRISQGHTGRKLLFTFTDRTGFAAMGAAAFSRLVLTQIWPTHYALWISIAGAGWALCFLMIGWRVAPFLWKPRIDGKVH